MAAIFYLLAVVGIVQFALAGIVPEQWFEAIGCAGYWLAKIVCMALVIGALVALGVAFWPRGEPAGGIEGAGRLVVPPLVMMAPAGR